MKILLLDDLNVDTLTKQFGGMFLFRLISSNLRRFSWYTPRDSNPEPTD